MMSRTIFPYWLRWMGTALTFVTSLQMGTVFAAIGLEQTASIPNPNVEYPGPDPGPARATARRGLLTLGNNALTLSWRLTSEGLRHQTLRMNPSDSPLSLTGEVFQILLADGPNYRASEFISTSKPRIIPLPPNPQAAQLAQRVPGKAMEAVLRTPDGRFQVIWRAILRDHANFLRQEFEISTGPDSCAIRQLICLDDVLPGTQTYGRVDGSPLVADNLFLGIEDPHARNGVESSDARSTPRVCCRLPREAVLRPGEVLRLSLVIGVSPPGQMRRAFLHYLEHQRAHPYRPFLHYNSWYDIAWQPFALNATNCLEAIRLFGERFIKPYGVSMDALVFDDGWDNPKSLWQFHSGFPEGFEPLAALCKEYNTRLGVWLSPFGGYGEPRNQRLKFGHAQGYETNATGFSLAGPKYYAAFKQACVNMIHRYGVNHFKFDGIAAGMYASGGADYVRDTEAMRRLMLELRRENPALYINLTTGSWPSPFWLMYADSVWRQGDDMGFTGPGPKQQQWITYRDRETYRNIVSKGPLFPLNSLMTQGVAYSRQGHAGDPAFNSIGFRDDVRAFFGSGTGLQELYIQPGKLTVEDWRVLAEAAQWSRVNASILADTHWIGGDPGNREVYGWAAWAKHGGIITLRNPNEHPQDYFLDVGAAFELPDGAPRRFSLKSPWQDDAQRPAWSAVAGKSSRLTLQPFQVLVLEARPAPDNSTADAPGFRDLRP
ncbi:MAG TPA: enterotoxin [Candidatus Paceibacterota bacterium]|nr:enterotoxin [Verrucomicrobiota bacterium]HRY49398.1 enterotoxin [Candidatus Paceibacterota bacterium]